MKTQEKKPESVSHTLQAKGKSSQQPPVNTVLQAYKEGIIQRATEEEEEPLQMKTNATGLPDNLKSGVEALSGYSMDDVRVHYNSSQPAQFQALAYTQGSHIHVASGQEQHLAHEAWHVVQQKQGRVQPTMQMKGINVNDDEGLEREADEMGNKAMGGYNERVLQRKEIGYASCMQRRRIHLGLWNKNVTSFLNTDFQEITYDNQIGRFKAKYLPRQKQLNVKLPVYFPKLPEITGVNIDTRVQNELPDVQKTTFITAVNETWSNKHGLNTTVTRYKKDKRNLWQEKLNSVKVDVAVLPTANVDDAFFKITHNDSDYGSAVWPHQGEDAPAAFAALSQGGYIETLTAMNKDIPAGATNNIANPRSYNVFAHEAGHMFGLDDEYQIDNAGFKERIITEGSHSYDSNNGDFYNYVNNYWRILPAGTLEFWHDPSNSWHPYAGPALSGTPTRHQNIVPRAVVPGIADAVMDNNRTDNSIMGDGYQVHERHYVTFLKALLQSIQGAGLETDKAPVKEEDWKIGN